jgi:ABC-type phosphate transport system substrate-binding protein
MTFLSMRRMLSACVVGAAATAALAAPGTASATDLGTQCSGANIEGLGSTFQAPAQKVWNPKFNESGQLLACNGTQGSTGKPTVIYNQGSGNTGSGACLHDFGAETTSATKYKEFPFCGTDEAPNVKQKEEIESHAETGVEAKALETIPVLQGAVAVIVNLPTGCKAQSEITSGTKKFKLGRLVFNNSTVEGIYRGSIKTWKEAVEAQGGDGADKLTCTVAAEEEQTIKTIVRRDKSGTTHIFKSYLGQVNEGKITMEEFNEPEGGSGKKPCGAVLPEEEKTWLQVSEGCENQRWPTAAKITRPASNGNPAVIEKVATTPSSIGYADLAVTRENGEFSKKFDKVTGKGGGENKKGSETKLGEQNERFWVELQHSAPGVSPVQYADPASNGDIEKAANSNCAGTIYAAKPGEKFPPKNTRETWFAAKAELTQKKYNICGLTYALALRQYFYFLNPEGVSEAAAKEKATTVENYLLWVLNSKNEGEGKVGGGYAIKNHDYEKLSGTVLKEAETGVKEIGNKIG